MADECFDADITSQCYAFFVEVEVSAISSRLAEEKTDVQAEWAVMCIHLEKTAIFQGFFILAYKDMRSQI